MAEKDTAEKLASEAKATEATKEKSLPVLAQPTVSLPVEIRQAIAIRCRDQKESFSIKSVKMWITTPDYYNFIAAYIRVEMIFYLDFHSDLLSSSASQSCFIRFAFAIVSSGFFCV